MLIDARQISSNKAIDTDVCIVGAGASGITLAREFINQQFRVTLLESGGFEPDPETQSLCRGENIGHAYFSLDSTRLRYFGGTTNHWGGMCRPLDEIDFKHRPWVPHSGWPFGKAELEPYYERAQSYCQLGKYEYDARYWEDPEESPCLPVMKDRITSGIFQFSPPTRFGQHYRDELVRASNINVYLYANVLNINTADTGRIVTGLRVKTLQGNEFRVTAKLYILAVGGIETPRLLLLSNDVQKAGLGNENDLVGRFFMDQLHAEVGLILPSNPYISTTFYEYHQVEDTSIRGHLSLREDLMAREKLAHFSTALKPESAERRKYDEAARASGVRSFKELNYARREGYVPDDIGKHLRNILSDIDDIALHAYSLIVKPRLFIETIRLFCLTEQVPNPESRITLNTDRDRFGQNRARLNWQLTELDAHTIRRSTEIVGVEFGRAGLGRLKIGLSQGDPTWLSKMYGNYHHMGTTRMHPKQGVVDRNCRIHGTSNLFVAGSSVFPTSGYSNPTLTIVALAIRLADHVKELMRKGADI